jgi:hypothetical protein
MEWTVVLAGTSRESPKRIPFTPILRECRDPSTPQPLHFAK